MEKHRSVKNSLKLGPSLAVGQRIQLGLQQPDPGPGGAGKAWTSMMGGLQRVFFYCAQAEIHPERAPAGPHSTNHCPHLLRLEAVLQAATEDHGLAWAKDKQVQQKNVVSGF